jgi:hypothetical protein
VNRKLIILSWAGILFALFSTYYSVRELPFSDGFSIMIGEIIMIAFALIIQRFNTKLNRLIKSEADNHYLRTKLLFLELELSLLETTITTIKKVDQGEEEK